jgi:hypothetical protein
LVHFFLVQNLRNIRLDGRKMYVSFFQIHDGLFCMPVKLEDDTNGFVIDQAGKLDA